ncbi:hypothetical protein V2J09_004399 [Rumex salicifolius]
MKEENPTEKRPRASKFADQNQPPKMRNLKSNTNTNTATGNSSSKLRSASTWGSNIVKGLSGGERKSSKVLNPPLSKKVHPHGNGPSGSQDLYQEIENLRDLLKASKQRELKLQAELSEYKNSQSELQRQLEEKRCEVDEMTRKIGVIEVDRRCQNDQALALNSGLQCSSNSVKEPRGLEMEVVELRRLNKELQLQKRDLSFRVASMESHIGSHGSASEIDMIAKIKAEASLLRHTNEDLCKQVEGLQLSRLNEVEELAYLRWVNTCLRNELSRASENPSIVDIVENNSTPFTPDKNEEFTSATAKRLNAIKQLKKWPVTDEEITSLEGKTSNSNSSRRHSTTGLAYSDDEQIGVNDRRQSDGFMGFKEIDRETIRSHSFNSELGGVTSSSLFCTSNESGYSKISAFIEVEKRALRTPNPPPRPSCCTSNGSKEVAPGQGMIPPPLPPPPPPPPPSLRLAAGISNGAVKRAPQVVELYHSLMKRDLRKESAGSAVCDASTPSNVRSTMIDEIENRSAHLLAIKADVETQADFVRSLIAEVDERAVLKHFEWPEKKADTLREAAFGYQDLKKLETEVTSYTDDTRTPCDMALKKMVALSEKMERTIYSLSRTRESLMHNCKDFQIPTKWMHDNGIISKVKLGSVKLAKQYMNRVASELQSKVSLEKDPAMDYMLLQGVRFAFRIHQFAGGFDAETMQAFEELRKLAHVLNKS